MNGNGTSRRWLGVALAAALAAAPAALGQAQPDGERDRAQAQAERARAEAERAHREAAERAHLEALRAAERARADLERAQRQIEAARLQATRSAAAAAAASSAAASVQAVPGQPLPGQAVPGQRVGAPAHVGIVGGPAGGVVGIRARAVAALEKATFLGVSTGPVSPALREQLKLGKGLGLLVEHVEKSSPAEAAGVQRYDILQKLDDQLLVNAHQLSVLVRNRKPGDEVELTLVREGKPRTVKAKLVEKDLPPLDDAGPWGAAPDGPMLRFPTVEAARDVIVNRLDGPHAGMMAMARTGDVRIATLIDGDLQLSFTRRGGSITLTAIDLKADKVLFTGPIDTAEQRKGLPSQVSDKLETDRVKRLVEDLKRDEDVRIWMPPTDVLVPAPQPEGPEPVIVPARPATPAAAPASQQ